MSDTGGFESTVRILFVGDPRSLVAAYQEAADAAQSTVDRIKEQAASATGSLEETGGAVSDLGVKFEQAGAQATGLGEKLDTIGEGAGASVEGLQAKFDGLDSSIAGVDEKLATVADTATETGDKVDESSSVMAGALARVGTVLEGLEGKFGLVGDAAAKMGATINEAAGASDAGLESTAGAADGLSGALATIGKGTVIGLAVAAAGALDLADKMDQATGSIAANAGISTAAAQKIGSAFDSTAGQFIMSGTAMAKAYAPVAAQLGALQGRALTAGQALTFMKDAANASEATGASLSSTTSALAATMQAYQIGVSGATSATNNLYVAGKITGTGFDAVSSQLDKMRSKLGDLAPPLSQSAALLVDLTEHGETGRVAMSALTTAVTGLEKPTLALTQAQQTQASLLSQMPPGLRAIATEYEHGQISAKAFSTATTGLSGAQAAMATKFGGTVTAITNARDAIKQSGIAVENSKGQLLGLGTVIEELHKQIEGETQAQALATLASDGLGSSAAKLLPTIEAGSAAFNAAHDAVTKQNAAQIAAQKATANLADQFKKVKSAVEDVFTEVGERLMPVIQGLISVVIGASSFLNQHRVILIGLGVAIGTVLVPAIAAMAAGWAVEAAAMIAANAPLIAIAAAIGLLAAGAYELYKHWNVIWPEIKKITLDAWNAVKVAFDDVWHFIERWGPIVIEAILVPFTLGMSEILPLILHHWSQITAWFKGIPGEIESFLSGAITWLLHAGEAIITGLWHGIEFAAQVVWNFFLEIPNLIASYLAKAGDWLYNVGVAIIHGLVNGAKSALGDVTSFFSGLVNTIRSIPVIGKLFGSDSPYFTEVGKAIMSGLTNGMLGSAPKVHAALRQVTSDLTREGAASLGTFNVAANAGAVGPLAGGPRGSVPLTINVLVDGQKLATVITPDIITAMQARGRVMNLGI